MTLLRVGTVANVELLQGRAEKLRYPTAVWRVADGSGRFPRHSCRNLLKKPLVWCRVLNRYLYWGFFFFGGVMDLFRPAGFGAPGCFVWGFRHRASQPGSGITPVSVPIWRGALFPLPVMQ